MLPNPPKTLVPLTTEMIISFIQAFQLIPEETRACCHSYKEDQRSCSPQLSSSEPQFSEEVVLKRLTTDVCVVGKKKILKIKAHVKPHHESTFVEWSGVHWHHSIPRARPFSLLGNA